MQKEEWEKNMNTKMVITRQKSPLPRNNEEYIVTSLFEEDQMCEVVCENSKTNSLLGNIYVGKVKNIIKNLNAAFIQIADGQMCYYSLDQYHHPIYVHQARPNTLTQGDELVVQVTKEAIKTKDPVVTTNITFSGKYVVLSTENLRIGISNKLDPSMRKAMKALLEPIRSEEYGFIVRTNARNAASEEIVAEAHNLIAEFQTLKQQAVHRTCFSCLKKTEPQYIQRIRGMYADMLERIQTDDKEIYDQILQYLQKSQPELLEKLSFYEDASYSLSKLNSIPQRLEEALQERVWLKSGAYLIIQPTEALTVIDVNSGKNTAKKNPQENFRQINLEAAREIAHQLRLRNISGICVIDFIDLESKEAQTELIQVFTQELKKDPIPTNFVELTKLGLVEITRKKVRKSLYEQLKGTAGNVVK